VHEGNCKDLMCNLEADQVRLVYHTNQIKKKNYEQSTAEMVVNIREIRPKK